MVYIREAHPADGWVSPGNSRENINITDPRSQTERNTTAHKSCLLLNLDLPILVDTMDDTVNKTYQAWPDRIYIVDKMGKIALMSAPGPRGFAPGLDEASDWLSNHTTY